MHDYPFVIVFDKLIFKTFYVQAGVFKFLRFEDSRAFMKISVFRVQISVDGRSGAETA